MASSARAPLNVVLFQPEIPQNAGNVARTCVAVSAKLWLVRPLGFRLDDRHLRRSGLDYWEHLDLAVVDDWEQLVPLMPAGRVWYFSKSGTCNYTHVHYCVGDFLVFGSESRGLPPALLGDPASQVVRIPIRAPVRSLNLSNAVAVGVYEALRQWEAR